MMSRTWIIYKKKLKGNIYLEYKFCSSTMNNKSLYRINSLFISDNLVELSNHTTEMMCLHLPEEDEDLAAPCLRGKPSSSMNISSSSVSTSLEFLVRLSSGVLDRVKLWSFRQS
jgi:hypothetical protein